MTNKLIFDIAMTQSAVDSGCSRDDFRKPINKTVISTVNPDARKYLELPFLCDLTSYGSCIVASVSQELRGVVDRYINTYPVEHCFETPNLLVLQNGLKPYGVDVCFMAEYFLPDMEVLKQIDCGYELRELSPDSFDQYYLPQWGNALCEKRKHLDVLVIAAFDKEKMIGMAGCSADCDSMWQIGIDVIPEYRRRGVAASLTSAIAIETIRRNRVPFYCCAWSNIGSVRNAINSGFKPAWVQVTAKKMEFIRNMNRQGDVVSE